VVSDILPSVTAKAAHYVLPGCAHVEKRGSFVNAKGRVQKFMKALEPKGDARPELEILTELLAAITGWTAPRSHEGLFNQMAGELPALQGVTWAALGDIGVTVQI